MNTKPFITKRNVFILLGLLALVTAIALFALLIMDKPHTDQTHADLVAAIDTAWNIGKTEEQPAYLTKLDRLSSYRIHSVEREGDVCIVSAIVTAPDLGNRLTHLDADETPQSNREEDVDAFLCTQVDMATITDTEATLFVYDINGEYHVSFSNEFADAMSGKLYSYSQEAYLELLQKYKEGEWE